MSNHIEAARQIAPRIAHAFVGDAYAPISLAKADPTTTIATMAALMGQGIKTPDGIFTWLQAHGSRYGRDLIEFFLTEYDGGDTRHCMWWRDRSGDFTPSL